MISEPQCVLIYPSILCKYWLSWSHIITRKVHGWQMLMRRRKERSSRSSRSRLRWLARRQSSPAWRIVHVGDTTIRVQTSFWCSDRFCLLLTPIQYTFFQTTTALLCLLADIVSPYNTLHGMAEPSEWRVCPDSNQVKSSWTSFRTSMAAFLLFTSQVFVSWYAGLTPSESVDSTSNAIFKLNRDGGKDTLLVP